METQATCKTCDTPLSGPYCYACGQKVITRRITVRSLLSDLFNAVTNLERGLWHTIVELLRRPAQMVRNYIDGSTRNYYPPLRYAFLVATVSTFIMLSIGYFDTQTAEIQDLMTIEVEDEDEAAKARREAFQANIQKQIRPYITFMPFILLPFLAMGSYLLYRKRQFNYAEHLVVQTYSYAQITLLSLPLFYFYNYIGASTLPMLISLVLTAVFLGIVFKGLFSGGYFKHFLLGLLSWVIGYLFFFIFSLIIGMGVGIIIAMVKPELFQGSN